MFPAITQPTNGNSFETSQGPAPKGQTLIKLGAESEPCAELCAESNADRLPDLPGVPRHTLLPKSRDVRLFALWHRLFASGAKGRWFESTRAYHSNHVGTGIPCMLTFQ